MSSRGDEQPSSHSPLQEPRDDHRADERDDASTTARSTNGWRCRPSANSSRINAATGPAEVQRGRAGDRIRADRGNRQRHQATDEQHARRQQPLVHPSSSGSARARPSTRGQLMEDQLPALLVDGDDRRYSARPSRRRWREPPARPALGRRHEPRSRPCARGPGSRSPPASARASARASSGRSETRCASGRHQCRAQPGSAAELHMAASAHERRGRGPDRGGDAPSTSFGQRHRVVEHQPQRSAHRPPNQPGADELGAGERRGARGQAVVRGPSSACRHLRRIAPAPDGTSAIATLRDRHPEAAGERFGPQRTWLARPVCRDRMTSILGICAI